LAAVLPAMADDTAATIGAGGLIPVKSSSIVMESEDLHISVRRITVKYLFRNTSNRDADVVVAFPLPEIDGGMIANTPVEIPSRDPLNFMDFEVTVDGKKIEPRVEVRAFTDAGEITAELRPLGLPLSVLDENFTAAFKKLSENDRADLEKTNLVDCPPAGRGECRPQWKSRIQYYWPQRFPANATVDIQHSYRPIVGGLGSGGAIYINQPYDQRIKEYCGGSDAIRQIERQRELHPAGGVEGQILTGRDIDFVLTTANNWLGPIRTFRLSVVTERADDIVVTCMPGLKRVAPTQYEAARSDFRPESDLKVLVLKLAEGVTSLGP